MATLLIVGTSAWNSARVEARPKRKSPVKTTEPAVKANEYRPAELADAVRAAAIPLATAASAVLGPPVCPSGVKRSPTMAAQCIVAFDKVNAAYVIAVGPSGSLVASPVFLIVPRIELERELAKTANAAVRCGKAAVIVVPSGSATRCDVGKGTVDATVTRQGAGWTVSANASGASGAKK
jgi:hypothetical protein